jgi:hypothetical protein
MCCVLLDRVMGSGRGPPLLDASGLYLCHSRALGFAVGVILIIGGPVASLIFSCTAWTACRPQKR